MAFENIAFDALARFERRLSTDEGFRAEVAANPDALLLRETGFTRSQLQQQAKELSDEELLAFTGGQGANKQNIPDRCPICHKEIPYPKPFHFEVHMVTHHSRAGR